MPTSQGTLKPFVTVNRSAELYNSVAYPVGGNVTSSTSAVFVATWTSSGGNVINATYMRSGQIVPGMGISGIGIQAGTVIVGPLNQNGTGVGGIGSYTISKTTTNLSNPNSVLPNEPVGTVITASATPSSYPQGPGGVVGPVPGYNCVNIMDLRDYYNLPYPPATPLASPPVIAIVSFGGGIYGQPVTTGQYAGFWKCTDISGNNGAPIQILVAPINGAINAPNADDGGATLENTVDVATVNAFYGMIDPRRDAPIYTPPVIILYIAPSSDISEMYRTFYTVLKNPVVCNGKSYQPTVVSCSWGAPEIAWTQKMAFPPNASIPVDNDPNPAGIAELNEINDLFGEATKNGINICCASGDIPLSNINNSVNTFNYAQQLLLQGAGGAGASGQTAVPQPSVFPLTDNMRSSLSAPQVMFPASSPYVTCVGGSSVYFPNIATASYGNAAEFAWDRANGGISSVFSIPAYQQELPSAAATSAAQFLASALNTAKLSEEALGVPVPVYNNIAGSMTAPNSAVTLATVSKNVAYSATLNAFNTANAALQAAQAADTNDALVNVLVQTVKDASTALSTAEANKELGQKALDAAEDLVVKTQTVAQLLSNAATVFGAASAANTTAGAASASPTLMGSAACVNYTQTQLLAAQFTAQNAAYTQLVTPSTNNAMALQNANQALQAAQAAVNSSVLAASTLPAAVPATTDLANMAVAQAAAAVVAPTLSAHPYLMAMPVTSPLVPKSNGANNTAVIVAGDLPYDPSATTAPPYLLTSLGIAYTTDYSDASGVNVTGPSPLSGTNNVRQHLNEAVEAADLLVLELVNVPQMHKTGDSGASWAQAANVGPLADLTNAALVDANAQLKTDGTGDMNLAAADWQLRADTTATAAAAELEQLPQAGVLSLDIGDFATAAINTARGNSHRGGNSDQGAVYISSYLSGGVNSNSDGHQLPCGLASAAASALAAVWTVTQDEKMADKEAGFPYGSEDTSGGMDASGTYNGITKELINLRNIYANTTLAARRTKTANKAAHDAKEAFLVWAEANEQVTVLQSKATTLYNQVPAPSHEEVRKMDAELLAAKIALSDASYKLGVADEAAVVSARLAQQSAASTSLFMGNYIGASGTATFDQLGNLNGIPSTNNGTNGSPDSVNSQGVNRAKCPAINDIFTTGTDAAKKALIAAQALSLAAANDNYLTTSVTTWNTHGVTGVDTSGNQTVSLAGTRLLVQDAQYAAAGAAGQVAKVAFADATESLARLTDWQNVSAVARQANVAQAAVYAALTDASGNADVSGNNKLRDAVNAIEETLTLLIAASTPYNQQATTSATIATNNVVVLASKLENAKNVCLAAQTAIQLAASTYRRTGSSNISGQQTGTAGGGGSIFTINLAYAKVTADAAAAACTAAAILAREDAVDAAVRTNYSAIAVRKLVGEGVCGRAIAGFLDSSGNLVAQTGYDATHSLPYTQNGTNTGVVNNFKPPAVDQNTILFQGAGGLDFSGNPLGGNNNFNNQPSTAIITNLAYTTPESDNVYGAVKNLETKAQAVIRALQVDSSGNTNAVATGNLNQFLIDPFVNAGNALDGSGNAAFTAMLPATQSCLLAAYEAMQWVVASANASFVTFSSAPANVNLVTFTPTLLGVANKLASDADAVLQTVLNAEGAILFALSQRNNPVVLHDVDAANFAAAFNANQSAADTYDALTKAAIAHKKNTVSAFHNADLANALSPLAATAATAAQQAATLGAMAFTNVPPVPAANVASSTALQSANFPAGGWGSAGANGANLANPNAGPYNGTSTGAAPFPAPNASASNRPQAPAASVLAASAQFLARKFSDAALLAAKSASDAVDTANAFNALMLDVSTVTPSLVDAATAAAQNTLIAAKAANDATSSNNDAQLNNGSLSNVVANLLIKNQTAILAAAQSASANLEAISPNDARYASRLNMVNLWNAAVDAGAEAVQAAANAPTNYPHATINPAEIVAASLGDITKMGTTPNVDSSYGNSAPTWFVNGDTVVYASNPLTTPSVPTGVQPSLLSILNAAVINAYNATTGSPDPLTHDYRLINFADPSGNIVTNLPENVNDTEQAYNNAVAALNANAAVGNSSIAAVLSAALKIKAAYDAAVAALANANNLTVPEDSSGNLVSTTITDVDDVNYASHVAWANSSYGAANTLLSKASVAVTFWNCALQYVNSMVNGQTAINATSIANLMSVVGINFNTVQPANTTANAISAAEAANVVQADIMRAWQEGPGGTYLWGTGTATGATLGWPGYVNQDGTNKLVQNANLKYGQAFGTVNFGSNNLLNLGQGPFPAYERPVNSYGGYDGDAQSPAGLGTWSAYYYTLAIMGTGTVAYETARDAWNTVLSAFNAVTTNGYQLDLNAATATNTKAVAVYSVKIALQSAARAGYSAQVSAAASGALATSSGSYEDLAAEAAAEASYASSSSLHMYRCVPDVAMHANADDLPVIFRLNGGNVYVGGTAVAAAMFAGFLGVVQSQTHLNFFVNPVLYDNYTFPSPLFNDISGSRQVWYPGSVGGPVVPPRIANVLPGLQDPESGLGSGLYNCNVGLGSIKGMNLAALMDVPHPVTAVRPNGLDSASVTVYPGTSATVTAYVEPFDAYNPYVTWSISSPNAVVSQTNGPKLSNNGMNDTNPYTGYNPLARDASGNQLAPPSMSIGNYGHGSVGNVSYGASPFSGQLCAIFTATVTGVTAVPASAPLPVVTLSTTDGSTVYGTYSVVVLPAVQVSGVSISAENERENPSNTTLFLGTTLQLNANVTPFAATNKRVYWWSSNTSVVNVDASGLLTSLAPGQVTIKATSLNNNISASISVYVPTPITGLSVLPTTITLNPNMGAVPLKNLGLIRAIVQPAEADYKHLTWEVVSSTQAEPAPAGISDVVSLPLNGTILARDASGDITDNTEATVTALSNGTAVLKVSTYGEPYGVYGTYTAMVTVNVVTPVTDVVMTQTDMVINLNPHTAEYDSSRSLPESYKVTATLKPAYPSNMNVFWSSSNPKVAVVSNNSPAVLNTTVSDPNFGLWQITETVTPLSNGTTVIKVTTADGSKTSVTTVVVTTPVTGLSMSALPVVLNPTKLYTLQATVLPTTATNRALVWESTNTAVATVDSNGVVKAITSGSCGISATSVDGDFSAISQISVVTPLVGVQLMVNTPLPIHVNDVVQILVVMVPTTASNQQFTWTVTDGPDGNVFSTGPPQNGNIVYLDAIQAGSSMFTVTTADGNKQASIQLNVVQW